MKIRHQGAPRLLLLLLLAVLFTAARGLGKLEDGYALLGQRKYDKATEAFEKALAEFKRKGVKLGAALGYEGLAEVESARGRDEAAVVLYRRGLEFSGDCPRETVERLAAKRDRLEDRIYQHLTATASDRWETFDRFLSAQPQNRNVARAREQRDSLQYQPALAHGTLAAYVEFIEAFPNNLFVPKAVERTYALWQKDFAPSAADAVRRYDLFLRDFPASRLRAAAMTMKSYYTALLAETPEPFADFYEKYKVTKVPLLGGPELATLNAALERVASQTEKATPFLLLYENTGNARFLERAASLLRDSREESYFVRRTPQNYFRVGEPGSDSQIVARKEMLEGLIERSQKEGVAGLLAAAYVPKLETTARPAFDVPVFSRTTFGRYRVTFEFKMRVLSTWRMTGVVVQLAAGLSGQRTSGEATEEYTATASTLLAPGDHARIHVDFGEITTSMQQSFVGIAGIEQSREILDVTPTVTSVALVDPAGTQEWKVEIAEQDRQSFGDAARSFNALAATNRSPQIDQLEEQLVRGVAHVLTEGTPPP